jgi:hypothetical protein
MVFFAGRRLSRSKVPSRNFNHVSGEDWNRCRYGIFAHAGLAQPLDLNGITVCSICRATSEGYCGEHVEATLVGIFTRFRNLAQKGTERINRYGHLRIFEMLAVQALPQLR